MAAVCESSMPGHNSVLADPAAAKALLDVIPADFATLNELDASGRRSVASVELIDEDYPDEPFRQFWDHFWNSLTCSYTEAIPRLRAEVMGTGDFYTDRQWHSTGIYTEVLHPAGVEKELLVPLPAPPGIARRLVFFRGPGRPFTDDERHAALLLQPHITWALRRQARLTATRLQAPGKLLCPRDSGATAVPLACHCRRRIAACHG